VGAVYLNVQYGTNISFTKPLVYAKKKRDNHPQSNEKLGGYFFKPSPQVLKDNRKMTRMCNPLVRQETAIEFRKPPIENNHNVVLVDHTSKIHISPNGNTGSHHRNPASPQKACPASTTNGVTEQKFNCIPKHEKENRNSSRPGAVMNRYQPGDFEQTTGLPLKRTSCPEREKQKLFSRLNRRSKSKKKKKKKKKNHHKRLCFSTSRDSAGNKPAANSFPVTSLSPAGKLSGPGGDHHLR